MAHAAPTAVWSLDHTASSTLSIAKDVIRAATSDNVQPLALITCEKFGATLAMCSETNKKIEDLITKVSGPKLVKFISAQIGYSANDCATQLSYSLAGVQFLGLAAALVSTTGTFEGANALSAMVMSSASDKTLLPTTRQLKDLLGALEHRVNRSGFADLWAGYQIMLFGALRDFHKQDHFPSVCEGRNSTNSMRYPAIEGIATLVEAFRELNRLGNAIAITIQATCCAPWVMAFTRWCLGMPPSTYLPDGKTLLDQVDSRVSLFTGDDRFPSDLNISVQRSIDSPAELVQSQLSPQKHFGMVSLEGFGRLWCYEMGGETSDAYRAVSTALPFALEQVYSHLLLIEISEAEMSGLRIVTAIHDRYLERRFKLLKAHPMATFAQPFPRESAISNVLTRVLNMESSQSLRRLSAGHSIFDLSLVHVYVRRLAESCTCKRCQQTNQTPKGIGEVHPDYLPNECKQREFVFTLSKYIADILAISLFENPDTLLLFHSYIGGASDSGLAKAVDYIVRSSKSAVCGIDSILTRALALVGHRHKPLREESWIISCSKGQIVYPKLFETENICQPGYLVLYWAPGLLFYKGEIYERGIGPQKGFKKATDHLLLVSITDPLKPTRHTKMEWRVICGEGYLEVQLVCGPYVGDAFDILVSFGKSLIIGGCTHDSASPLERPDQFAYYLETFLSDEARIRSLSTTVNMNSRWTFDTPEVPGKSKDQRVGIVAVDGDTRLRMFAMSRAPCIFNPDSNLDILIRNNSCLQCCLNLCRSVGCHLVLG